MPRALPLAQFIGALSPQALQAGNQTTLESIYGQLGLDPRKIGMTNSPLGPIRGMTPGSPPSRRLGVYLSGNPPEATPSGSLIPGVGPEGGFGVLGELMRNQAQGSVANQANPMMPAGSPQPHGNWDVQNMGELAPTPVYPPGQDIPFGPGPATSQTQPPSQPSIVPRGTPDQQLPPWSYTPPAQTQQPQQGGISDAGMWGLIAAGLGILGNNYGNYGQWSPAVGKGGLIGVQTYLGQRQQAIENQRRDELARAETARWDQNAEYQRALIGQMQTKAERDAEQRREMRAMADALPAEDKRLFLADPEGYVRGVMAARKPGEEHTIQESLPGNKVQDWRRNPATGLLEKWGAPYDRRGEAIKVTVAPEIKTQEDFNQASAKEQAKSLMDEYNTLKTIPSQFIAMNEAEKALAGAGGFVGSGAETKLAIAKFFNNNFGTDIGTKEVENAEVLRSSLFRQIMENLRKLDAQPSQQQQRIMQESLGSLGTDPNAIPRIIKITRESLASRAREHNRRVKQAVANKAIFLYDITIPGFDEPVKQKAPWEK